MCKATLLPDPDSPLRMMMRTLPWYPAAAPLQVSVSDRPSGPLQAQGAYRGGVVVGALLLVLLDAAVELVREQINGRVHIFVRGIRMDGVAAHVQRRLGLLSQLLHRQYAMYVHDLIEVSANALQFLLHIAPQCCGDVDVVAGYAELHTSSP